MTVVVRFAPSPTGLLHVGNARPALYNWLFARAHNGTFVFRLDDTDRERSRQEYADQILVDLGWLGIRPDRFEKQSARFARYDAVVEDLKARGLLYPCYETAEELDYRRKRRRARNLPPIYDRAALALTEEQKAVFEAEGRKPHWRFLLPNFEGNPQEFRRTIVAWEDLARGPEEVDLASLSDPVLIREDGTYLYTLPSVVDDIDMGITHVIRGEDHVTNTGVQIAIFRALGGPVPFFGHINLLADASGEGFSKRLGTGALKVIREDGFEAEAVAALCVRLGTSRPVEPIAHIDDLAAAFDLKDVSRSAAHLDMGDLAHLNARVLHLLPHEEIRNRAAKAGLAADPALIEAVHGNLEKLADLALWQDLVAGDLAPVDQPPEDLAFLSEAANHLPIGDFGPSTWSEWTTALKAATGRKGRGLFHPLRLALTGREQGPELAKLLPLIGREKTLKRLTVS